MTNRTLTVFVVGDGAIAGAVRAMAESWTRAGIVEPSLWVTPKGVKTQPVGPPVVEAAHVHHDGVETVDLFEFIGRYRLDVLRVVAAHLVLQSGTVEAGFDAAAQSVSDAIQSVLPRRSDASLGGGSRLHRSLVVVPTSGASGVPRSVFKPEWEVNVVISPEDRPDIDRASVFVRHPGNFAGHAAAALSAIGSTLRGVDVGVLDELRSEGASQETDAIVARVSIRSILGEDLAAELADVVLHPGALTPELHANVVAWGRLSLQPDVIVEQAADHLLGQPEWRTPEVPHLEGEHTSTRSFWSAVKTAALFNLQTVGAVLSWILTGGRERFERVATETIIGGSAGVLVTLGPRPVEDFGQASTLLLNREHKRIREQFRAETNRVPAPPGSTWQRLRKLCFSLVDGGDLDGFAEPRQAGKRELLAVDAVVVPPDARYSGGLTADDPRAVRERQQELEDDVADAETEVDQARGAVQLAEDAIAPRTGKPANEAEKRARAEEDGRLKEARRDLEAAETHLTELLEEQKRFTSWVRLHERTLLWRVGEDVGRRIDALDQQLVRIQKMNTEQAPPIERLREAQRDLTVVWGYGLPLWLLPIAGVLLHQYGFWPFIGAEPLPLRELLHWLIGLPLLAIIYFAVANHRFYKEVSAYEKTVERQLRRLREATTSLFYAKRERGRLELLYGTLRDWVHIVGEELHRPWAEPQPRFDELPEEVIAALPASMAVAEQPREAVTDSTAVRMDAYRIVFARGWASRQFEMAYDAWEETEGEDPDEGYRAIDLDSSANRWSTRGRFREFCEKGGARKVVSERLHVKLRDAARDGELRLPARVVHRLGRYGDDLHVPELEFYRATATESTVFSVDVFSPQGRQHRRHYVDSSTAWLPLSEHTGLKSDSVELRHCDGPAAVRVDLSQRLPAGDLSLFSTGVLVPPVAPTPVEVKYRRPTGRWPVAEPDEVPWH